MSRHYDARRATPPISGSDLFGALAANLLSDLFTVYFVLMEAEMISPSYRFIYDGFKSLTFLNFSFLSKMEEVLAATLK